MNLGKLSLDLPNPGFSSRNVWETIVWERKIMRYLSAILFAVVITFTSFVAEAQTEVVTDSGTKPEFASSVSCAKCHQDIYNYWKESLHANALSDHIFQASFMIAIKEKGDEVRDICMSCHAPTTTVTGDMKAALEVTKEAVTCDFCHRISDIEIGEGGVKVTIASGEQKYGPLPSRDGSRDGSKETHPSVQSALFTDSKLCAVCHQWNNAQGVAIFDTYREWLNSPYPEEGTHCQNCHMPLVEGSLVNGSLVILPADTR